MPCIPLKSNQRFGGTYRLYLQDQRIIRALLATCFHTCFLLGLFEPEDGSAIFLRNVGYIQRTTWRCIPEDSTLHNRRYKNLKSYNEILIWELEKCTWTHTNIAMKDACWSECKCNIKCSVTWNKTNLPSLTRQWIIYRANWMTFCTWQEAALYNTELLTEYNYGKKKQSRTAQ
jgi:hypothetical protein